jgi:hypothetical protein
VESWREASVPRFVKRRLLKGFDFHQSHERRRKDENTPKKHEAKKHEAQSIDNAVYKRHAVSPTMAVPAGNYHNRTDALTVGESNVCG